MNDWSEYVAFAKADALKPAPCPRCHDDWFFDENEPGTNEPYSCYCCANGSLTWRRYEVDEYLWADCYPLAYVENAVNF